MRSTSFIIAGVAVSYLLSGVTIAIITSLGPRLPGATVWLFGTVAYVPPSALKTSILPVAAGALILLASWRRITALLLGEDVASSLGVNVRRVRVLVVTSSAMIVAPLVAIAGPVGFIGLVAPWISRLISGSHFGRLTVYSIVIGALLSLSSDVLVRLFPGPAEIPLTAVTAVFGAPILFYLSIRSRW